RGGWTADQDCRRERPRHASGNQDRDLWRTRRRAVFGRVLRAAWVQLRLLLAVPCTDRAAGGSAGRRQRGAEDRGWKDKVRLSSSVGLRGAAGRPGQESKPKACPDDERVQSTGYLTATIGY